MREQLDLFEIRAEALGTIRELIADGKRQRKVNRRFMAFHFALVLFNLYVAFGITISWASLFPFGGAVFIWSYVLKLWNLNSQLTEAIEGLSGLLAKWEPRTEGE